MPNLREALKRIGVNRMALLIAAFVGLLFSFFYYFDFSQSFEGKFIDARFMLREQIGPLTDDKIIIVAIDDQSLESLGVRWPWPRSMFAQAIDNLSAAGAHVVAFDLIFSQPSKQELIKQDKLLGDAIDMSRAWIILGSKFYSQRTNVGIKTSYVRAIPDIDESKTHVGYVNYWADDDGVIRHAALLKKHQGQLYQSFVLRIIARYLKIDAPVIKLSPSLLTYGPLQISVSEAARMIINYRGGTGRFKTISYENIVNEDIFSGLNASGFFKGKIVLIGPTFTEAQDNHVTPYFRALSGSAAEGHDGRSLGLTPGVEIHANVLNTILSQNYITTSPSWLNYLVLFVLAYILAMITIRHKPWKGIVVLISCLLGYFIMAAWVFLKFQMLLPVLMPWLAMVTAYVLVMVYRVFTEELQYRRVRTMFSRYVSSQVVDELLKNPDEIRLGGEKQLVTVLFSDIRGFTAMSEQLPPEEVVDRLNEYFQVWTDLIFKYDGMVDKFIGDAVMAIFGAPVGHPDDPIRAVKCALEMDAALARMQERWQAEGKHIIRIGVGINTGEAIVGNMGSEQAMGYTVIGDTVNLASRLESKTKELGQTILISSSTYEAVRELVEVEQFDEITVKGKAQALSVYAVKGLKN